MTQSFSEDELDHLTPEEHEDPQDLSLIHI